jgi:hypothetical protein
MTSKARTVGTRDEHYNLISVLYHTLHGAENCDTYALDAEAVGKDDLAAFFRNVQATHRQVAEQAKARLGIRGIATLGTAEVGTEMPPEGIVGPEAPPTPRDVHRGTSPEVVPPGDAWRETTPGTPAPEESVDVAPPERGGMSGSR